MTPQEIKQIQRAIKHYKNIRDGAIAVLDTGFGTHKGENDIVYRNRKLYAELAISALEKQVPEKANIWGDGYSDGELVYDMYDCPNCGKSYELDYQEYLCCPSCGQAIDWSEGE